MFREIEDWLTPVEDNKMIKFKVTTLLASAALSSIATAPQCPDDFIYDCLLCAKIYVGLPFNCCMTPASYYCCPAQCVEVRCAMLVNCPLLEGDGIERSYGPIQSGNCHPIHGACGP